MYGMNVGLGTREGGVKDGDRRETELCRKGSKEEE